MPLLLVSPPARAERGNTMSTFIVLSSRKPQTVLGPFADHDTAAKAAKNVREPYCFEIRATSYRDNLFGDDAAAQAVAENHSAIKGGL